MQLDYLLRASRAAALHPRESAERIRGRVDARSDRRARDRRGAARESPPVVRDPGPVLHDILGMPWPCPDADLFEPLWADVVAELETAGARVGLGTYRGWNDGDRAMSAAVWCLVAHLRPAAVLETGVAHGLTSRVVLDGLERNGLGQLSSIDLPATDTAIHDEIGMAVPRDRRARWTYVAGTSRRCLPRVLAESSGLDLFVHDSLHTRRNTVFELNSVWPVLRGGGAVVVDDIDRHDGFDAFVAGAQPRASFVAEHLLGSGRWGLAVRDRAQRGTR